MRTFIRSLFTFSTIIAVSAVVSGEATVAFADAPVVTSIHPTSGTPSGGSPVTIEGSNFQSGALLRFGHRRATTVVVELSTRQ